jgi:hypothetical protein
MLYNDDTAQLIKGYGILCSYSFDVGRPSAVLIFPICHLGGGCHHCNGEWLDRQGYYWWRPWTEPTTASTATTCHRFGRKRRLQRSFFVGLSLLESPLFSSTSRFRFIPTLSRRMQVSRTSNTFRTDQYSSQSPSHVSLCLLISLCLFRLLWFTL